MTYDNYFAITRHNRPGWDARLQKFNGRSGDVLRFLSILHLYIPSNLKVSPLPLSGGDGNQKRKAEYCLIARRFSGISSSRLCDNYRDRDGLQSRSRYGVMPQVIRDGEMPRSCFPQYNEKQDVDYIAIGLYREMTLN